MTLPPFPLQPAHENTSMHTLSRLLLFLLAAAPSFSRPLDPSSSILPDEDPVPILFLPPSIVKSGSSMGPLFITGPTPANHYHQQGSPPPTSTSSPTQQTTLTVVQQATETVHVVAATQFMTVTVTIQAPRPSSAPHPDSDNAASSNAEMKPFVATYFPDWTGDEFSPEKVDFKRFAWIDFAFAVPDENRQLTFTSDSSEDLLSRLVKSAHAHGSRVKLSIGGWTGSRYFSSAVSTDANRRELVNNTIQMYKKFNLDGIDLDWEYPGVQGAGNNQVSPQDSARFLTFLQLLRSQLPESAKLTAATQVTPFAGPDGRPLANVSEFAKVLDWILIMNYDIWGASPTPGPNAPLRDGCHNSTQPDASASASVAAWTAAGFPPHQITLGLPSYGYVQTSNERKLIQRSRTTELGNLHVRRADGATGTGSVRVKGEGEGDDSGQVQFKQLVKTGALKLNSDGNYVGAGGFNRLWDVCSSTVSPDLGRATVLLMTKTAVPGFAKRQASRSI
ncbi:Chitotriosidase-1 OS=Homo sapiens GN=CHIT1 PE=1 SV=1 [Rhizoctonia solani AG-1 IB]|uniref:Chitotriosidase-1 n=1 Tax=Thanatephorus cucumeris (strain AG1-IB / isolate 7/3/14) TaxID=1108050 RepID=A0A0B7G1B3_THACB|nr:Chitotriosidase-1 OS=Homo sapiens GN=CHIT1 PE=1 SV=1 [Rhizoctonia solani AG-1 IB]